MFQSPTAKKNLKGVEQQPLPLIVSLQQKVNWLFVVNKSLFTE